MYNKNILDQLIAFISAQDGITDKERLSTAVQRKFSLRKNRSVFFCNSFAVRFCTAASSNFGNTVLSLSSLRRYDTYPFIVCLVTPKKNYLLLANTTFLKKISHSSQSLREDNVRGSFNGSDIMRCFEGLENIPENFEDLFSSHENYPFEANLKRLVEQTNNIAPTGTRFIPTESQLLCIKQSVDRAISFLNSDEYERLKNDLDARVQAVQAEIVIASSINNVNERGRIIEYLITAPDDQKIPLIQCLHADRPLPDIHTADALGDYEYSFHQYLTQTDIKSKLLSMTSNPKGYNIDKLLQFLGVQNSVYLIYIVAIDSDGSIRTQLCSMFNRQLLSATKIISHWAGRNSRGVTQYDGRALKAILDDFDRSIDYNASQAFLGSCLSDCIS